MTREEQIVEAAKAKEEETSFCELVKSPVSRGVDSACGIGFIEGAIWADEHPDLYSVTRKAVERERKHLIDKACEWLEKNACDYEHSGGTCDSWFSASDLVESFRKYMEEQQ